ncbi:hypothetical protein [Kitasatospora sp. GAS1066B]|uniref:hypothetical protein n=1 Tax=Kitasatospora sp. GAS1066B TaxID=3156271 RepID=UPI003516C782
MGADFVRLSVALTGFEAAELAETGMVETYRALVLRQLGDTTLGRLAEALAEAGGDPRGLADPALLEVARALCHLWYLGVWPGLPGQPGDQAPVRPSAAAYAQGLLWRAMGSHAPGTHAPGFGSWAEPPAPAEPPPAAEPPAPAQPSPARADRAATVEGARR